jgi:dephospho-CoA kinase
MTLLGLTGGLAMGKSTVAQMLRQRRLPVVDTDDLARDLVNPGQPALDEIFTAFGPDLRQPDGTLNRTALAQIVFADPNARQRLEGLLHPRIHQRWLDLAAHWRAANQPAGVVVIPLLFETGSTHHFDATLCTACSPETQANRIAARGWTPENAAARIRAQWPIDCKIAASTHVLWTEGTFDVTARQLDLILRQLNLQPVF